MPGFDKSQLQSETAFSVLKIPKVISRIFHKAKVITKVNTSSFKSLLTSSYQSYSESFPRTTSIIAYNPFQGSKTLQVPRDDETATSQT